MPHGRITLPVSGRRIQRRRELAGLTLRNLAALCGAAGQPVSNSQLSKIERDKCRPRPKLLSTLAKVLDTKVEGLLVADTTDNLDEQPQEGDNASVVAP